MHNDILTYVKMIRCIAEKELERFLSEKTILLALLIQVLLASFSSVLVLGIATMYNPTAQSDVSTTFAVTGDEKSVIIEQSEDVRGVDVDAYESLSDAKQAYASGEVSGILQTRVTSDTRLDVRVFAPPHGIEKTTVITQAQSILKEVESYERYQNQPYLTHRPLSIPESEGGSTYYEFMYAVLIPILVFLPVFLSGSITVDTILSEFTSGQYTLLRTTMLTETQILIGKTIIPVLIAPLQTALWLSLLSVTGIAVSNVAPILLLSLGVSMGVVAFGTGIGVYYTSRKTAQVVYSLSVLAVFAVFQATRVPPLNLVAQLTTGNTLLSTWVTLMSLVLLGVLAYEHVLSNLSDWASDHIG